MSKNGLNYFPLCCQPDDKLNLIEAEYGIRGTAVLYNLFQKIYCEKGYYCEWDDEVGLLFSSIWLRRVYTFFTFSYSIRSVKRSRCTRVM